MMGSYAVDLLAAGKTKRVVGYKNGEYVDFDINEALAMEKGISEYQYEVAKSPVCKLFQIKKTRVTAAYLLSRYAAFLTRGQQSQSPCLYGTSIENKGMGIL